MHNSGVRLGCLVIALLAVTCAAAEDYQIKFHRPPKVGDRYLVTATGATETTTTPIIAGQKQPPDVTGFTAEVEAVEEVLTVGETGDATKLRLTINKCIIESKDGHEETIPAGTVITGTLHGGETLFEIKDGKLSATASEVFALLFDLDEGESTTDEVFGTKERKKPGDSWPINVDAGARDLIHDGIEVSPADISGSVSLLDVREYKGQKCLELMARCRVGRLKPAWDDLPAGLEVAEAALIIQFSGLFPEEVPLELVKTSMTLEMTARLEGTPGPEGQKAELLILGKKSARLEFSPLP